MFTCLVIYFTLGRLVLYRFTGALLLKILILGLCIVSCLAQAKNIPINDYNNENKQLTMCVSHYPPYQVVAPGKSPIGENIAVTHYFFKQQGFTIQHTENNTFWRCLAMLEAGKVDIMSGLLDAPERREFAHLFAYSSLNEKSFYVNDKNLKISSFADLKGLKVAVIRDIKQFKQFDNAPDGFFEKVYVSDLDAAIRVLAAGKVDVFISTNFLYLNKIKNQAKENQNIEEIKVKLDNHALLFTALSKKSKFAHLAPEFAKLSKTMYENGEFKQIIHEFKLNYPEYYR